MGPTLGRWLSHAPPASRDSSPPSTDGDAGVDGASSLAATLRSLSERYVLAGSLGERVLADVALRRADDAWLLGDPRTAWRMLHAALDEGDRAALPAELPPAAAASPLARTPLVVPRALVPRAVLLLRLGDLARAAEPALADLCYSRAEIPEASSALTDLLGRRR